MTAQRSTADILDAAVHVRDAARGAVSGAIGVDTVLEALSEVMEYDHASLARWDPLRRRHTTLAGSYPDDATAYIETRLHHDPVFPVLRSPARGGLWMRDVPRRLLAASPGFQEVLSPLGIEDGVAQCLFAGDGRYVGMLNISTRRPRHTPDPVRAVVTLLTEALAAAVDSRACPPPEAGASAERASVVRASAEAGASAVRAVDARRPDARRSPGGLSPRELQVLAELTAGRTNREIAERLYITPRTVGTHIEHILAKLDLPNRAAAAARAVAWGIEPAG
ncbi:LuxR C-terminal-related transcriptional regulator [Streptomyces sp. NPDC059352]|uniref:helix-turn-helix transcriptional regulator n=1 Tax=Streptomyces sp. NPDC059352 TaxID=3346810 RepID=UPI00368AEE0F